MSTLFFVRFSLISIFAWLHLVKAYPVLKDVDSSDSFAKRGEGKFVLAHLFPLDGSTEEFLDHKVPTLFSTLATWGTGKYTLDLDVYHRQVKPIFIKRFQAAFKDFTSKCGTNPDFEIDRNGIVNPNAVKGKDLCTKKRFSLDLGDVVLAHQFIPDDEEGDSEVENVPSLFNVLATWGTGRTLDLDVQTTKFNSALDSASAWILSAWI